MPRHPQATGGYGRRFTLAKRESLEPRCRVIKIHWCTGMSDQDSPEVRVKHAFDSGVMPNYSCAQLLLVVQNKK